DAWHGTDGGRRMWMATLRSGADSMVFVPDQASATAFSAASPSILITPRGESDDLVRRMPAPVVALNATGELHARQTGATPEVVPIFRDDIARFTIGADGIALPSWVNDPA